MTLPSDLRDYLAQRFGTVNDVVPVGGGSINSSVRVTAGGDRYFLKLCRRGIDRFYAAEANGLEALRTANHGLRIPEVLGYRDIPDDWSWIVLEWLDPVNRVDADWERLGSGLGRLHRSVGDTWGWHEDGFIGSLPQRNTPTGAWADFWIEHRLEPQLELARGFRDIGSEADWARLFRALPELLAPAETDGPSLIHGDLWSGNVVMSGDAPALVDPSVYRGHREVDIAMAMLFGGFDHEFFAAYEAAWPLLPGYEVRRAVYQIYYLLVHVNLFGSSYVGRTAATLRAALRAI